MKDVSHLRSAIQSVDQKSAAAMAVWSDPDFQRPLVPSHTGKLSMIMLADNFLTGHIVIAILGGRRILANGQHTLQAIIETGRTQRCLVEEYAVKDKEAYARLFHAFDTEARTRSWVDCARAYQIGSNGSMPGGVTPSILNAFRNGYEFYRNMVPGGERAITRMGRFDAIAKLTDELAMYVQLAGEAIDLKLVRRAPVIGAMIATFWADRDIAPRFWREVVTGFFSDHGNPDAPTYRLHQYLRNTVILTGGAGGEGHRARRSLGTANGLGTQFDVYCCCINAWNAHCQGRSLQRLRGSVNGKAPAVSRPYAEVFMA